MQNISSPSLFHHACRLIIFPFSLHLVAIFALYYTFSIQLSRKIVTTGYLGGQKYEWVQKRIRECMEKSIKGY